MIINNNEKINKNGKKRINEGTLVGSVPISNATKAKDRITSSMIFRFICIYSTLIMRLTRKILQYFAPCSIFLVYSRSRG